MIRIRHRQHLAPFWTWRNLGRKSYQRAPVPTSGADTSFGSHTASSAGARRRGGDTTYHDSQQTKNLASSLSLRSRSVQTSPFNQHVIQPSPLQLHSKRWKSSVAMEESLPTDEATLKEEQSRTPAAAVVSPKLQADIRRLEKIRIVGILAHVDAGKTTCTERMLALAGIIRRAGSVDDGDTVTDYLPAERERGITIQSAAVTFPWKWHNQQHYCNPNKDNGGGDNVQISLIDTPGHIDFSVEVHRSVAVLDGAVLVVDAVAGVQAQTETVWRAMKKSGLTKHHEPLPCLLVINKMDKDGCNFAAALQSLRDKLPGANPIPIQLPLFRTTTTATTRNTGTSEPVPHQLPSDIVAWAGSENGSDDNNTLVMGGEFVGVVDLIHMRAIVWPDLTATNGFVSNVEDCVPHIIPLLPSQQQSLSDDASYAIDTSITCPVTRQALQMRREIVEALANDDEIMADCYLNERDPTVTELCCSLRKAVVTHQILPVLASAAVRGKGVEPILDAISDLLPSPLDRRVPPTLQGDTESSQSVGPRDANDLVQHTIPLGHALHPSFLALAFKVLHMKGRGGSGDGRVVFARVYSGQVRDRDMLHVVSPPPPGEPISMEQQPRMERVGGMLELTGGRFGNLHDGVCQSGGVCALVGLKSVVTGDTLFIPSTNHNSHHSHGEKKHHKTKSNKMNKVERICLAGVSSPKPVLTVRLEAETTQQQAKLSEALKLLSIEDPSLVITETESATLLSGLGELHIEVTLDRLHREYGLQVMVGPPAVAYRETLTSAIESDGLITYNRTVGAMRLQGAVHLRLEPTWIDLSSQSLADELSSSSSSSSLVLHEPVVSIGPEAREYLQLDRDMRDEDLVLTSSVAKALIEGCQGALKRGPIGRYAMANVRCDVVQVEADNGVEAFHAMPGSIRAAASHAVSTVLTSNLDSCRVLEPLMSIEIALPNHWVGTVLSDLTSRRGTVEDVVVSDVSGTSLHARALIRGEVPLVEILGYANGLRSLTGGEGSFTAEYKGHAPSTGGTTSAR